MNEVWLRIHGYVVNVVHLEGEKWEIKSSGGKFTWIRGEGVESLVKTLSELHYEWNPH